MAILTVEALSGIPEVRPGADLAVLILAALGDGRLEPGQLIAIAHTAVSKSEGALVELTGVTVGVRARELAAQQGKDPRMVQVVLEESAEVLRAERGVLICRTRHGFVCANAGVDASNAGLPGAGPEGPGVAILLPRDPDASARAIRARLGELIGGRPPAVMITDSFGRAWRHGQVDVAIGLAGLSPLEDWRGRTDADGMELQATWLAVADAAAGAADLARAKDSREPVVVLKGLGRFVSDGDGPGARALLRPPDEDLFL
ncbi:MAG: coenzyme F420-0:L-glutamate ligase [Solirubrobacteraceae bacterium]